MVTTPDETEDAVNTVLLEQKSWEDVTADVVTADIQTDLKLASRLAAKSSQLLTNR